MSDINEQLDPVVDFVRYSNEAMVVDCIKHHIKTSQALVADIRACSALRFDECLRIDKQRAEIDELKEEIKSLRRELRICAFSSER